MKTPMSLWKLLPRHLINLKSLAVFEQVSVLFVEQEFAQINTKIFDGEKTQHTSHQSQHHVLGS